LKALGNDIRKNLEQPLAEIERLADVSGTSLPPIRVLVRSGDTPAHERRSMLRRPPHILITTPESLYILLTAERSRRMLATAETVIVDEIHAVAGDKRGAHLALSLERLDGLAGRRLQRIGLSATQNPIEEIARLLVGTERTILGSLPDCAIVDVGHRRTLDLTIEVGDQILGPIATHELYADIYERIAAQVRAHRTTIVFVNTRRLVERVAHQLEQRLGAEMVAAHHGSLSRQTRLRAEEGLKNGTIPVVVATASLELGIDVGHVDLVCHLGAPRALATLLQRVGRAGHWLGAIPKGILYPLTRDDLLQCAAAVRAVRAGVLDKVAIPQCPLDILAQQLVATVAGEPQAEDDLRQLVRRAYPFRHLRREDFEAVVEMLSEGVATQRGRRSAHLHRDRVHHRLTPRRGARLAAITSGGAIPDTADYDVIEEPAETYVGRVNEDFAVESMAGDIFLLGNRSWRIRRVEAGRIRVEDAHGAPPTIPFWLGEAPARTAELSAAVAGLRDEVAQRLPDVAAAATWAAEECALDQAGAEQVVAYIAETRTALGVVPTLQTVVAERFFDESGGMQLVLHSPFGGRINRAWGLALRKRFCRTFDFELQAAATDDGIVLSLGEQHSFPLDSVFAMVRAAALETDLVQAVLQAPMFGTRWRWNASRALALLRHSGGRRVPMPIQRMRAEDLLAAVFPAQVACQDNHGGGYVELPDHPLVKETIDNCLHEAMDVDGLRAVIESIERGEIRTVTADTAAPSPMSHEILNANPYAFLDDAPLEERRARAVSLRRLDADLAGGIGALDPEAVAEVRQQAWPDVRDADELHDLLLNVGLLPLSCLGTSASPTLLQPPPGPLLCKEGEGASVGPSSAEPPLEAPEKIPRTDHGVDGARSWAGFAEELIAARRATCMTKPGHTALVAAERLQVAIACWPGARCEPNLAPLPGSSLPELEDAVRLVVQGWMECLGPTTVEALVELLGLPPSQVEAALLRLESQGIILRGRFGGGSELRGPDVKSNPPGTDTASSLPLDPSSLQLEACSLKLDAHSLPLNPSGLPLEACSLKLQVEWCDRRLLARIHRLTVGRLRREIEPVSVADFIRFLLRWQHVQPGSQLHGRQGLAQIIRQLQGVELPAPAWERDILPARLGQYDPNDLEYLCLGGVVSWGRLRTTENGGSGLNAVGQQGGDRPRRRRSAPTRSAPLAFVLREALPDLLEPLVSATDLVSGLSPAAREVLSYLQQHGAAFLTDIARATRRLQARAESALWELVARGLVTGDGIAGLRALLKPDRRGRKVRHPWRRISGGSDRRPMPVGRWALLRPQPNADCGMRIADSSGGQDPRGTARLAGMVAQEAGNADETMARQLLYRYGVVVRELLAREPRAPRWRTLLALYRRMEARGEIRGGRFVGGLVGEQFALPEAVDTLRSVRRAPDDEPVVVSAADPLNLVGILTPGARVSPLSNQVIAYANGVPIAIGVRAAVLSQLRSQRRAAAAV
jgi:ATP-dependent Lhr-like helicase